MFKTKLLGITLALGLACTGLAAAQEGHDMGGMVGSDQEKAAPGHEGMAMENCICHMTGVTYKAQDLKDGATLTLTSKDPAAVRVIQERAKKMTEIKDDSARSNPDEMVTCPVEKTKIQKSKAYESTVYKGKTYYFCCAGCKPKFLKDPEKYAK